MARQLIKDGFYNSHPTLKEEEIEMKVKDILCPWFAEIRNKNDRKHEL